MQYGKAERAWYIISQEDDIISQEDDIISQEDDIISQEDDIISQEDDIIDKKTKTKDDVLRVVQSTTRLRTEWRPENTTRRSLVHTLSTAR